MCSSDLVAGGIAKGEVKHQHSRQAQAAAQGLDLGGENAQVLCSEGQGREVPAKGLEEALVGRAPPEADLSLNERG